MPSRTSRGARGRRIHRSAARPQPPTRRPYPRRASWVLSLRLRVRSVNASLSISLHLSPSLSISLHLSPSLSISLHLSPSLSPSHPPPPVPQVAENHAALHWMVDFTSSRDVERHFQHPADDVRSDVHIPGCDRQGDRRSAAVKAIDALDASVWGGSWCCVSGLNQGCEV